MILVLQMVHRFLILLVIFGLTILYVQYKVNTLTNFSTLKYCPPVQSQDIVFTDFYSIEKQKIQTNSQGNSILLWTPSKNKEIRQLKQGKTPAIEQECNLTNFSSIITDLKSIFSVFFSVLTFYPNEIPYLYPEYRSNPKFVIACKQPGSLVTVTQTIYDYFTWMWTHKIDANIFWRHFIIYDEKGNEEMNKDEVIWVKHLKPFPDDLPMRVRNKQMAVAWLRPDCTIFDWNVFVPQLGIALLNYNLTINTLGCGKIQCKNIEKCLKIVEEKYYFFIALETGLIADYLKKNLLISMQAFAVPIWYGIGISRIFPPGSYINSMELSLDQLAGKINKLMSNHTEYYDYFKWKSHYRYEQGLHSNICEV